MPKLNSSALLSQAIHSLKQEISRKISSHEEELSLLSHQLNALEWKLSCFEDRETQQTVDQRRMIDQFRESKPTKVITFQDVDAVLGSSEKGPLKETKKYSNFQNFGKKESSTDKNRIKNSMKKCSTSRDFFQNQLSNRSSSIKNPQNQRKCFSRPLTPNSPSPPTFSSNSIKKSSKPLQKPFTETEYFFDCTEPNSYKFKALKTAFQRQFSSQVAHDTSERVLRILRKSLALKENQAENHRRSKSYMSCSNPANSIHFWCKSGYLRRFEERQKEVGKAMRPNSQIYKSCYMTQD